MRARLNEALAAIASGKLDLEETIVVCGDFEGMLMEFVDANKAHFEQDPTMLLKVVQELLCNGIYDLDTGNGTSAFLVVKHWGTLDEREAA